MWVRVPDWMLADDEVPRPTPGMVLVGLGVRWHGTVTPAAPGVDDGVLQLGGDPAEETAYRVTGRASEARDFEVVVDDDRPEHGGADFVLTVGSVRFQVQFKGWAREVPEDGRLSVTGRAVFIGGYEWDSFDLGEVRTDWEVNATIGAPHGDVLVDVFPTTGFDTGVHDVGVADPAGPHAGDTR